MNEWIKKVLGWGTLLLLGLTVGLSFFNFEIPLLLWVFDSVFLALGFVHYAVTQGLVLYVIRRIIGAMVVLLLIASATFLLLRTLPGGPFDEEKALPPLVKANIEAKYKLNEPLYRQYYYYISGILKGDLGESYKYLGRSVTDILVEAFPASFQLGIYSLIVAFLVGIPLGLIAASRHNTWVDNTSMVAAISGVSLPSFLVAPVLIIVFCYWLDWLEPALWEGPTYYILPVLTLGLRPAAIIARLTRASVLDVIRSDYVRTALAKGLSQRTVLFRHVLKNSLIPVLTFSGPLVAGVLSGSFVVELIFAIPGMGKHLIQSVSNRDYPLVLAATLVFSALLVLANLIVDLLYSYFDPRIRLT